jgi:hypothetical protein
MLQTVRSAIPLLAIGAVALIGAIVLAGIGQSVPAELWAIAFAAITGGAGVTIPAHGPSFAQDDSPSTTSAAAAPVAVAPVQQVAP